MIAKSNSKQGLLFESGHKFKERQIVVHVDSSYANGEKRRSIYGYIIYIDNNILFYKSKKQRIVAQSSCEAEFVALAFALKEVMWLEQLYNEIGILIRQA